jgi:hypothetical protein
VTLHEPERRARAKDFAWAALAIGFGGASLFSWGVAAFAVLMRKLALPTALFLLVTNGLFAYWITMGAWRRTTWGFRPGHAPPGPPALSSQWAWRYIVVAMCCVTAAAIALAIQFWWARS